MEGASAVSAPFGFDELLPTNVVTRGALLKRGIEKPTPIQEVAVPRIYSGESVMLNAETGSGKTLAFLLPTMTRLAPGEKILVISPTRELALQLANEAVSLCVDAADVQLVVVGTAVQAAELIKAKVVVGTAPELADLLYGPNEGDVTDMLLGVRAVTLDEVDVLLPVSKIYGPKAAKNKLAQNKKTDMSAVEKVLLSTLNACSRPDMQIVAASATVSRTVQNKLGRILRKDPHGRWSQAAPPIVRPLSTQDQELSELPRAVTVPASITHLTVAIHKNQSPVQTVVAAYKKLQPHSAIIFVCASSGLTVRQTARDLQAEGLPQARALDAALGMAKNQARAQDTSTRLQQSHQELAQQFSSQMGVGTSLDLAGETGHAEAVTAADEAPVEAEPHQQQGRGGNAVEPVVVTFEGMARGLHFDGVDAVFILGKPANSATYLHLAGRTCRYPVLQGTVVTVCSKGSVRDMSGWGKQLGGVQFEPLDVS